MVREVYKHLSVMGVAGSVPGIGRNLLSEVCVKMGSNFVDYKTLKLSDIDLTAIKINQNSQAFHPSASANNPERLLIRCQFLEFLVRIAIEKAGGQISVSRKDAHFCFMAIKKFFEKDARTFFASFDSHKWRLDRYWT